MALPDGRTAFSAGRTPRDDRRVPWPKAAPGQALVPLRSSQLAHGRIAWRLSGQGPLTLLLFSGAGMPAEAWAPLHPRIEGLGRVLAWNRPGLAGSGQPRRPQSSAEVVRTLRELLQAAGLRPPYLLVAHSLGGLHANLFARLHPQEVAGVLLLEATHPSDQALLRRTEVHLLRGLSHVLKQPQHALRANARAEIAQLPRSVAEIAAAGPFPPVPLLVLTGGRAPPPWLMSPAAVGARRANQQALARLSPLGEQVIAHRSGHFPQFSEPRRVLAALGRLAREAYLRTCIPAFASQRSGLSLHGGGAWGAWPMAMPCGQSGGQAAT